MKVTYGAIVQRASGRFGGTVHSNWKGIDLVRRFAAPSNPNTTAQSEVRTAFKNLTRSFQMFPSMLTTAWSSYATGKRFIPRNAWLGLNVPLIAGDANLADLIPYPGDSGAVPPTAVAPTGGVGQITFDVAYDAPPVSLTENGCYVWAILDNDPTVPWSFAAAQIFEGADVSDPYTSPSITNLAAGTYRTWASMRYVNAQGNNVYSAAVSGGTVVVT